MNDTTLLPEAGPIRRVLALLYDTLVLAAITLSYVLIVAIIAKIIISPKTDEAVEVYQYAWFPIGMVSVNVLFFVYSWRKVGQTIGMRAWRLKLVNLQNQTPSIQQCLLRCVLAPLSIIVIGMGYWWCWFDKEGRSAHDRLTNTRVLLLPKKKK